MEKSGTIIKIKDKYMQISVARDSACGDNCAACGLCSNSRQMIVTLKKAEGFKVGDKVRLITENKKILQYSAAGYLSLTALLIMGAIIGGLLAGDWSAFLGAIVGTLLGITILKKVFTKKTEITVKTGSDLNV